MINLYIKLWKMYGIKEIFVNFFKYYAIFKGLDVMAEKFSVTKEWNSFKGNTRVGKNFTRFNLLRLYEQLKNQEGINFQKKIKFLIKT